MRVLAVGDAALDVVVELARPLEPDDDVPARITLSTGGQAANVAAWCAELGVEASVLAPLGDDLAGAVVRAELARRRVSLLDAVAGRRDGMSTAAIASLVTAAGARSMASDRRGWQRPAALDPAWFDGLDWLHVSGYELFAGSGTVALAAATSARRRGVTVSVDLSARTAVEALGGAEVARRVALAGAEVVFATVAEMEATGELEVPTAVVKLGAGGCRVGVLGGPAGSRRSWSELPAAPAGVVRDTTGAGDAFAAGWIVGGAGLALETAARCVGQAGAMPPPGG